MPRLTITQFILIIILNVLLFGFWYFTTPVRTVSVDKIVYKEKVVHVDDKTQRYQEMLKTINDVCYRGAANGVADFKLDDKGQPVFHCHY